MNFHRFVILGLAVGSIAACSSDNTSPNVVTPGPAGLIHIINAVPDTGALDFRFVDTIDGVPNVEFVNLPFRGGTGVGYQRVSVGSHHIRVFQSSGLSNFDPAVVSTVLGDTTVSFADGVHYTFIFYGNARANTQKFQILTDNFTLPSSGILIRAANFNTSAADFYVAANTAVATSVTPPPTFANVATAAATAYTSFPTASATSGYTLTATPAGATTPVWSTLLPVGANGAPEVTGVSGALQALPGSRITGSIFTGILFPASVTGSKAPSFATPGIVIVADRYCSNTSATATC
jgi:hypothetical protein